MHCILPITLADLSKKASYKKKRWPQSAAGDIVDHPFNRSSLLRITEGKASFLMFPACFFFICGKYALRTWTLSMFDEL